MDPEPDRVGSGWRDDRLTLTYKDARHSVLH
jgi:hypothetical protein